MKVLVSSDNGYFWYESISSDDLLTSKEIDEFWYWECGLDLHKEGLAIYRLEEGRAVYERHIAPSDKPALPADCLYYVFGWDLNKILAIPTSAIAAKYNGDTTCAYKIDPPKNAFNEIEAPPPSPRTEPSE